MVAYKAPATPVAPPPTYDDVTGEYRRFVGTWAANCGAPRDVFLGQLGSLLRNMGAFRVGEVAAALEDGVKHVGQVSPIAQTTGYVWANHIRRHYVWRGERDRTYYPVEGHRVEPQLCDGCPLIPRSDLDVTATAAAGKAV